MVPLRKLNIRERVSMNLLWRSCDRCMGLDPPPDPDAISLAKSEELTKQTNIENAIAKGLAAPYPPVPGGTVVATGGPGPGNNVLKFKMSAFIDQSDDSEVTGPVDQTVVEGYRAMLFDKLGKVSLPAQENPTEEQWFLFAS